MSKGAKMNKKMPIYVVHAKRWGDKENHSYIVTATLNKADALSASEAEEQERGAKYGCEVLCFNCGKKNIIRKPYGGIETFSVEKSS